MKNVLALMKISAALSLQINSITLQKGCNNLLYASSLLYSFSNPSVEMILSESRSGHQILTDFPRRCKVDGN
jgi:hypothetical protein